MADEETTEGPEGEEEDVGTSLDAPLADHEPSTPDPAAPEEEDEEDDSEMEGGEDEDPQLARPGARGRRVTLSPRNLSVVGQMTLHYTSRDVSMYLDGDAALRMLSMFQARRERGLADRLDAATSDASSGWLVFDLDEPLAMTWVPSIPMPKRRTAVDPAI